MAEAPVAPALPVQIPNTAGQGNSTIKTENIPKNSVISSGELVKESGVVGLYKNLGADIKNVSGFDILNFSLAPGSTLITNQETMTYMDGGLVTEAQLGQGGIWSGIRRGLAGSSVLQNMVSNPTASVRKITLSPLLQGSIVQIDIKAGESWRFADKSFLACTPNLTVSGNLNIFRNFRLMFVGENVTYTTVKADQGSEGTVWICAYGGLVRHDMDMGTSDTVPLFINNGCFLGMLDNNGIINFWEDYVDVGTANGLFSAMFTQLGWVMKIQDTNPPKHTGPIRCTVLTQSLNPHNLERYIANIANTTSNTRSNSGAAFLTSGYAVTHHDSGWGFWGQRQEPYQNYTEQGQSWNQMQEPSQNWGQESAQGWNQEQSQGQSEGGRRKTKKNRHNTRSRTYRNMK